MQKNLTKEQKYDLITKDFLERDGDTFVRIKQTDRIGWEDTLPKDSAYSSIILHPKSDRELLGNACRMARQMIISMNTPFKVNVYINADRSCTDSHSVFVATKVFDDNSMSLSQRLDVFLGLAIHEGSHLLYTDFEFLESAEEKNKLINSIQNILEDEMIERKLGEEKPGLANFLKATKYYYFGKYTDDSEKRPQDDLARLFNAILGIVRYPACLVPKDVEDFADELLQVRELLQPYPDNTQECMAKAKEIFEILKKHLQNQQEEGAGEGEGQESKGQENSKSKGKASGNGNGQGDNASENPENPDGSTSGQGGQISDQDVINALKDVIEKLNTITKDPNNGNNNGLGKNDMCDSAKKDGNLIAMECDGDLSIGETEDVVLVKPENNKSQYMQSLCRIKKYIPATAAALKQNNTTYEYNISGMRNGLLDTNKLGEARQGVQTVYIHKTRVKNDILNLVLVIDESGSMDGIRERLARDTAVLINEAIGNVGNVNLNIYGYTSGRREYVLYPYREYGSAFNKYVLGSITSRNGTPTAEAIMECTARVRKHSSEKALMFIISDGMAAGGNERVRSAVNAATRKGFDIVGISISSSLGKEDLKEMYDDFIVMNDISELAKDLGKTIKKALVKKSHRRLERA